MFDALSYDEQLEMLRAALIEAENSGDAGPLDMDDIRRKAQKRAALNKGVLNDLKCLGDVHETISAF
jgi:hypothetical protein